MRVLFDVFNEGYPADKVLERVFKQNRQLGGRDRRFIAETSYEIIRHWRKLWAAQNLDEPSTEPHDLMRLIGVYLSIHGAELPDWIEFKGHDRAKFLRRIEQASQDPAVAESVPNWLYELGLKEIGSEWPLWLRSLNEVAPVCLRTNRLKVGRAELRKILSNEDVRATDAPMTEDGLILSERKNVFTTKAFKDGFFEIQDGASQQVAPLLAPQPGQRIIDACAGAGGKTMHLAALMKNKGRIIAMDVNEKKLGNLRERCARGGVDIVETKVIESNKTIKRLADTADGVLLDVPCSGLGVLRRNPDKKWKISIEEIEHLKKLQAEILETYSVMAKVGGHLVYATCSCLPSENEAQVQAFLARHPDSWALVTEKKFVPGQDGYDGFYAARLERKK